MEITKALSLLFWQNPNLNKFKGISTDKKALSQGGVTAKILEEKSENLAEKIIAQTFTEIFVKDTLKEKVLSNNVIEKSVLNEKVLSEKSAPNLNLSLNNTEKISSLSSGKSINNISEKSEVLSENSENNTENIKVSDIRKNITKSEKHATSSGIKIDMSGMKNSITNTSDIDEFIDLLTKKLEKALTTSAEGVHG